MFGILFPLLFLLTDRDRRDYFIRFHCFQCLLIFAVWSPTLLREVPRASKAMASLDLIALAGWFVAMIMAGRGKLFRLPLLGVIADWLARL